MDAPLLTRLERAWDVQGCRERAARMADASSRSVSLRRAVSIRDDLLGRRTGGLAGTSVIDPTDVARRITQHLGSITNEIDRCAAVAMLSGVMTYAQNQGVKAGHYDGDEYRLTAALVEEANKVDSAHELGDAMYGAFTGAAAGMLKLDMGRLKKHEADMTIIELEVSARHKPAVAELQRRRDALFAEFNRELRYGETADDFTAEWERRRREIDAWFTEHTNGNDSHTAARRAEVLAGMREVGTQVHDALTSVSRVTSEQAGAWAASQTITKQAAARLKKIGYKPDDVRADMAEFYRLTGGRLASIKINSKGDKRANAEGIHGWHGAVVNIDGDFTKRTLFHEMGHHLEADPTILAAARAFLRRRATGGPVSMVKLTGNRGYRAHEVAYPDSFFHAYVGKVYQDATEVVSMGMQCFADLTTLSRVTAIDPEHISLMVGMMATPEREEMALVRDVRHLNAEVQGEVAQTEADERDTLLREIAARVILRTDEVPALNAAAQDDVATRLNRWYGLGDLVGWMFHPEDEKTVALVYRAAKVADYDDTLKKRRAQKGFLIVAISVADTDTFGGSPYPDRNQVVGDDLEMRARLAHYLKHKRFTVRRQKVEELRDLRQA